MASTYVTEPKGEPTSGIQYLGICGYERCTKLVPKYRIPSHMSHMYVLHCIKDGILMGNLSADLGSDEEGREARPCILNAGVADSISRRSGELYGGNPENEREDNGEQVVDV